ncbi:MAG: hypothetical protein CME06_07260 [Gemmatimonadetes bacterium]|nr:hypothetical protein [Gemmatimonadota bacterium]
MSVALGLAMAAGTVLASAGPIEHSIVFVQEPRSAERLYPGVAAEGSRIARLDPGGTVTILTEGFASAADPTVAFDGQSILFAGKERGDDPWNVWEMSASGMDLRRCTDELGDCREPIYLPRAAVDSPNFEARVRWIEFVSTAPAVMNDLGDERLRSLYAANLDPVPERGDVLWRTTYNLGGDGSPSLLSDGRVLYSARQRGALGLMTISWAGENLNPFYGSHDAFVSQHSAAELPGRLVAFIESIGPRADGGGDLAMLSLRRPLHSRELVARGLYRTPHPFDDERMLVSVRPEEGGSYGIGLFDPESREVVRELFDDPEWNDVDAMLLAPREPPPARIPTVEFASVLDVGSLRSVGQLQCLNVYESDRARAPAQGSVARVRLVEGVPRDLEEGVVAASGGADPDTTWPPPAVETRPLGEAPVEEDGSFYLNVAGDRPFYLELLDARGKAVKTMRAWSWVRSGDQRGCIGCHEDKELAPENRATQALIRAQPAMPPADRYGASVLPGEER